MLIAHFRVKVGDIEIGVQSVSRLHDLIDGEADPDVRMSVTLRRAATQDKRLFAWYRDTRQGKDTARNVTIVQLDGPDGTPYNVWRLEQARPVRWSGPHFDALANEIAMEEVELRYKSISWRSSY
jgi:phage tail-like protein